jgi:uncharacterized integral membrane protein (TIGR00698 family)
MITAGHDRARTGLQRLGPGLATAAVATAAALAVNAAVPPLSALTVAVVLGVAVGSALPAAADRGLAWTAKKLLRMGVVLLGLQLGVESVLGLGAGTVLAVAMTVVLAFAGTLALGRLLRVGPGLSLMVATGFSICGAAAIAAMGSVSRTEREDVATGVTLVTLYGTAAIAVVPLIGRGAGMTDAQLGEWAGLSVHEVAQVIAAASPAGAAAIGVAVVVKLTRVLLLAPMVAGVSVWQRRSGGSAGVRPPLVPFFVVGFLVMVAVRSTGAVPAGLLSIASTATTVLFAAALFGLGTAVRLQALVRTGRRGLVLGALATVLVGGVALAALATTGQG